MGEILIVLCLQIFCNSFYYQEYTRSKHDNKEVLTSLGQPKVSTEISCYQYIILGYIFVFVPYIIVVFEIFSIRNWGVHC